MLHRKYLETQTCTNETIYTNNLWCHRQWSIDSNIDISSSINKWQYYTKHGRVTNLFFRF